MSKNFKKTLDFSGFSCYNINIEYIVDIQKQEIIIMTELELLKKLALNPNLSKSEMNVVFFTFYEKKNSAEIARYLNWAAPNVARLLLTMTTKTLLTRELSSDKKSYLYLANKSSPLLNLEEKP